MRKINSEKEAQIQARIQTDQEREAEYQRLAYRRYITSCRSGNHNQVVVPARW